MLLVDDGLATGLTLRAAICSVQARGAAGVSCAVPVGSVTALAEIADLGHTVVCPLKPPDFHAVGLHYRHFEQLKDEEVLEILRGLKPRSATKV